MPRYSRTLIILHWAMALLILAAWLTSEGGRQVRLNPPMLHFSLGLSVLLLVVPRLIARWWGSKLRIEDPQGPWLNLAAKIGHAVLYLFMIGLPLTGWYAASRMGVSVSFFGLSLPALTAPVQGPAGPIAEIHQTGGTIVLFLAGLHSIIAFWHHFVLRDGTMQRMNPI
ncbi:cytochrome b [Microvirga lotononidis]|uniref:Cytochrome B561 n=1 Tax=Microvirga lotononidis TaxID=864069 RepID=I4YYE1_9HYPH|nr:cytochrome b [Microvirga lotononidis]EIM28983.1 cytochrome B561 [Microvirga lotononidis]WQO26898.1 cytochrome b [Microvirga lotononidis]